MKRKQTLVTSSIPIKNPAQLQYIIEEEEKNENGGNEESSLSPSL